MAIECRHCDGKGTCSTGENGNSCSFCIAKAKSGSNLFFKNEIASAKGLPCGACFGAGDIEGKVWHLQSTIGHMLGLLIVCLVLVIITAIASINPSVHPQILTLLGTLGGAVVGYYFKGQNKITKPSIHRTPKVKQATNDSSN